MIQSNDEEMLIAEYQPISQCGQLDKGGENVWTDRGIFLWANFCERGKSSGNRHTYNRTENLSVFFQFYFQWGYDAR